MREATGVEVYDRPAIILEIFHRHARTKEARLQVELARLKYLAPRGSVSGAKERRSGGRGARRVSESFHEIERRKVRDRTSELQRELQAVHREQVERRRHREGLPKVAIVGYTNAGKSSIMRALTMSEVLVANRLFATLDTTVRALHPRRNPGFSFPTLRRDRPIGEPCWAARRVCKGKETCREHERKVPRCTLNPRPALVRTRLSLNVLPYFDSDTAMPDFG
jgi:hypothetical protein